MGLHPKALLPLLTLAACSGGEGGGNALQRVEAEAAARGDTPLPCRTGGAKTLQPACLVERSDGPEGGMLTIRHPDGGFRRFRLVDDGRGLVSADGADPAKVQIIGNRMIQVDVGQDSYRLPATIGAAGR
ncbi:hypothetical protein [Sphingobium aquiterrae]|uniref:hypothetical protein n=1 Tax=Sphingobium aquiterrae TaxID=2038656 RepID=UPI003019E66B